ncbi:MAG: AAA family ATPase [Deltaproteobacteria bacterium]|nr:AAA family ATPase [Deltaproteobacteria bacterium]
MKIKHVEMVGFKSFVDKTRLSFTDGISVIVGPNGCGKSNVVDAIRWVMGELSAKSLRGTEMQDVIFAGSNSRKPTSMAQVSLLFSCEDGVHPVGYENVSEIEIARRLYRSGESEYFINRQACRLKDIHEMLMDTGIGARTYSVIEQGQIARVLSAKPQDRRFLIEDAAGITKYRVRREETERKLEATRQNLERAEDIISEIRSRVLSLARQAGRAPATRNSPRNSARSILS